jgi:hypothetical protein
VSVSTTSSSERRSGADTGLIPDEVRGPRAPAPLEPGEATLEQELQELIELLDRAGEAPCLVCGTAMRLHDGCPECGSVLD